MNSARPCRQRLEHWAAREPRLRAVIVYGSVAAGADHQYSDLDVVLVTHENERDSLWQQRRSIAAQLLGTPVAWAQEVPWQRPYRFQAWEDGFEVMVDVTIDEGRPQLWRGLVDTHEFMATDADVADEIREELLAWSADSVDAASLDQRAWPWLGYLDTNLRKGNTWMVRSSLHGFLNVHVLPLLADRPDAIESDLTDEQRRTVHEAAPDSSDTTELRRALRRSAELYQRSLADWSRRHTRPVPAHPMADPLFARIQEG